MCVLFSHIHSHLAPDGDDDDLADCCESHSVVVAAWTWPDATVDSLLAAAAPSLPYRTSPPAVMRQTIRGRREVVIQLFTLKADSQCIIYNGTSRSISVWLFWAVASSPGCATLSKIDNHCNKSGDRID